MPKRKTTEQFINDAKKIHNNEYDYSLVNYKNNKIQIEIICSIHGIFLQRPSDHLSGCKCPYCYGTPKKTNDQIKKDFLKIHNNQYDYSLVDYNGVFTKIKIKCTKCNNIFEQTPHDHLKGQGCPKCIGKNRSIDELKNILNNIHNNKYNYELLDNTNTKIKYKIVCPIHGEFLQYLYHHINGEGCPKCNESKGEKEIRNILEKNNIKYESQKTFPNCKHKQLLKFDFYLPNHNIIIEYDGEQHFKPNNFFGGDESFKNTQIRDNIKNEYCKQKNINLLRIKYDEKIIDKLSQFFF